MDDPGIHPIYDAVGRAVQAAASLEMWLAVAVNPLAAKSFERASKLDIKDQTRLILRHTAALPAGDVERLH